MRFALLFLIACNIERTDELVATDIKHLDRVAVTDDAVYWTTGERYAPGRDVYTVRLDALPGDGWDDPILRDARAVGFGDTGFVASFDDKVAIGDTGGHEQIATIERDNAIDTAADTVAIDATRTTIWTVRGAVFWREITGKQNVVTIAPIDSFKRVAGTKDAIYADDGETLWRIDKQTTAVTRAAQASDLAALFPGGAEFGNDYRPVELHGDIDGVLWMIYEDTGWTIWDRGVVIEMKVGDEIPHLRLDDMYPYSNETFVNGGDTLYWYEETSIESTHQPSQENGGGATWSAPRIGGKPCVTRHLERVVAARGDFIYTVETMDGRSSIWRRRIVAE